MVGLATWHFKCIQEKERKEKKKKKKEKMKRKRFQRRGRDITFTNGMNKAKKRQQIEKKLIR